MQDVVDRFATFDQRDLLVVLGTLESLVKRANFLFWKIFRIFPSRVVAELYSQILPHKIFS